MTDHQGERGRTGATGATGEAGETGETGEAGLTGRRGEAGQAGPAGEIGVPGRQGEAGVSGRQGEAGAQGRQGQPGVSTRGETGKTGATGRRGISFSNAQVTAVFLFVVLAFVVLSIRTEIQQRQLREAHRMSDAQSQEIAALAHRIEVTQFEICTSRNLANRNQIRLIDSAIAAEKRKPKPDAKRLRDLEAFKPAVPSCGPRPQQP